MVSFPRGLIIIPLPSLSAPVHKKPQASSVFMVAFSVLLLTSFEDISWSWLLQLFIIENTRVKLWIWQSCEQNSSWPRQH